MAPKQLRKYVEAFSSPFPLNTTLFQLLAETINWSTVTYTVFQRFRAFGGFLRKHCFRAPLTWQTIEDTIAALDQAAREGLASQAQTRYIRQYLKRASYLLAAKGQLESREAYIARRSAFQPLASAPAHLQALLKSYAAWLWEERKLRPDSVGQYLEALASFWKWCEQRNVGSPSQVSSDLVKEYLLSRYQRWRCSACQGKMAFDPSNPDAPRCCVHCHALGSLVQENWYAQRTVCGNRAALFVFFAWAKLNRLVYANPVQEDVPVPPKTIRYYPPDITRRFCSISSPDTNPTEGLILYLILVHACTLWELQHAKIPVLFSFPDGAPTPSLAQSYYLIIPKKAPSRGRHSPGRQGESGRSDIRLDFPPEAAFWLKPLLERFERQRQEIVKNSNNPYLLVIPGWAYRQVPVSAERVRRLVGRASLHILGATCNLCTLRKTAAVIMADTFDGALLLKIGWQGQQAFAYEWAPREMIPPGAPGETEPLVPSSSSEPSTFPSPQDWNSLAGRGQLGEA